MQIEVSHPRKSFEEIGKQYHLKITPQRIAVYNQLMNLGDCHPSAEMIYSRVHKLNPHISFDTVNRTLLKFAEIGIVDILKGISGPRRFDPGDRKHHHIFCEGCGAIIDFDHEEYDNLAVPEEIQKKYRISGKRMVLTGLCEKCIRKNNKNILKEKICE